jgi:integrase
MKCWSALLIPSERFASNRQSSSLTEFTPSLRVALHWKIARQARDHCILARLVGIALRRKELSRLTLEDIQLREGRGLNEAPMGSDF